jgi:hypothetical protein
VKGKFKVGDSVYATHNTAWGYLPMRVVEVRYYSYSVIHPAHGEGWFPETQLELFSEEREAALARMAEEIDRVHALEAKLFGGHRRSDGR